MHTYIHTCIYIDTYILISDKFIEQASRGCHLFTVESEEQKVKKQKKPTIPKETGQ